MLYQMTQLDWNDVIAPLFIILVLFTFIGIMGFLYFRYFVFVFILAIFLFSLIFGAIAINLPNIPFSPWFQIAFMFIQTLFFIRSAMDFFNGRDEFGGE